MGKIGSTPEIPEKIRKNNPYDTPNLQPNILPQTGLEDQEKAQIAVEHFIGRTFLSKLFQSKF